MYRITDYFFKGMPRWQQIILLAIILAFPVALYILPSGFDILYYYRPALNGTLPMHYPYWGYWLFAPLKLIPFKFNYMLLVLGMLAGSLFLLKTTRGNPWQLLLSFPMIWVLYYGQAEWLAVAGLLLMWYGLRQKSEVYLGIGLVLASLKPHITGPAALLILWQLKDWRLRLRSLWLILPFFLLSLLEFGLGWSTEWIANILHSPYIIRYNNGSLWEWVGPWASLLWIPALLVRLPEQSRVMLFLTTAMLTMPYVPPYSQLTLYFFGMPWIIWLLGYLPWLQLVVGDAIFKYNFLVPAIITLLLYFPGISARIRIFRMPWRDQSPKDIYEVPMNTERAPIKEDCCTA